MANHILVERKDDILTLRFNRPEKKNALTGDMYLQIADTLEKSRSDEQLKAIVFLGHAEIFSAGNDIVDFLRNPPIDDSSPVMRFLRALPRVSIPMLAGVDGVAIGVGTTLLLHCDLVYVTERAVFQLPFVDLGLVPEAGSSYLLPRLVGTAKAAELILLGRGFGGGEAVKMGLANGMVQPDELELLVLKRAQQLATKPVNALKQARRLLRGNRDTLESAIQTEAQIFAECLLSAEAKSALSAFVGDRSKPTPTDSE